MAPLLVPSDPSPHTRRALPWLPVPSGLRGAPSPSSQHSGPASRGLGPGRLAQHAAPPPATAQGSLAGATARVPPTPKPLQNLTTVARSAAATLHGHCLTPPASQSSEKQSHALVCRALRSLVPAGALAVSPAPLSAQPQSHWPPCCPWNTPGGSRLAAFSLPPPPENLLPAHLLFAQRASFHEDFPVPPSTSRLSSLL